MLIGCLHYKDFSAFALTYQSGKPSPLAVVASGRVVAVTPSAAKSGIQHGMQADRAACLLPELRLFPRNRAMEETVWEDLLQQLYGLTPFLESPAPGTAYIRAEDDVNLSGFVAWSRGRGGIAPARSYALLASIRAGEGRTVVVKPDQVEAFLERFPTSRLAELGFSEEIVEDLKLFGLSNLLAVYNRLTRKHLKSRFSDEGDRLYAMLHPSEEPNISWYQPPPTVGTSWDFDAPVSEPGELLPLLEHLAITGAQKLEPYVSHRIRLTVQIRGGRRRFATRILPEATGDSRRIVQTVKTLLVQCMESGLEIMEVSLELGSLSLPAFRQQTLFKDRPSIFAAVKAVHRKYPGALLRAVPDQHVVFSEDYDVFEPFPETPPAGRTKTGKKR
jgi:hypothetical protein